MCLADVGKREGNPAKKMKKRGGHSLIYMTSHIYASDDVQHVKQGSDVWLM